MSGESSDGGAGPLPANSLQGERSISRTGALSTIDRATLHPLPAHAVEELISIGQSIGGNGEQQAGMTPRLSIISTATLDDFSRNLYKISSNIAQMRTLSAQLGGPTDSHDHRAKL